MSEAGEELFKRVCRELEELVPGGSEYHDNPLRCIRKIKEDNSCMRKLKEKLGEKLREAQTEIKLLQALAGAQEALLKECYKFLSREAAEGTAPMNELVHLMTLIEEITDEGEG